MKTRVVLIDGHAAVREMLASWLGRNGGYRIISEAGTGVDAIRLFGTALPQLVILDLVLPELSGLEVLRHLRKTAPRMRVMIFSGTENPGLIAAALDERPRAYVHKSDPLAVFQHALEIVSHGACFHSSSVTGLLDEGRGWKPSAWESLSDRERAVLQMVAEGSSTKKIAGRLALSPKTVEGYRAQVMRKLNLRDIPALTRYAVARGLIPLE